MANKTKQIQEQLRRLVSEAVENKIYNPKRVLEYIIDNGWGEADPHRATIEKLLKQNGVDYVYGFWDKVK